MNQRQKKEERCQATQLNPRTRDFDCIIMTAHTVHIDSVTRTRWAFGPFVRGWHRRWKKNYGNPKLSRQSALASRRGDKEKLR